MPDITPSPRPALVVIPGVPLVEVGEDWPTMTGPWTVTADDIAAAVAAQDDPAVRSPIIRLGHVRAGQPAFGRFTNLRAENDGMTLVADLVGAPAWLADVLPYAFPSRSVEAAINATTETGRTHACRIDAVALLGVELPAISTLDDVEAVYTAATMEEAGVVLSTEVAAARGGAMPPALISAAVSAEDVRRSYYDSLGPGQGWWWIRELQFDPPALIVDDDEGGLWRVAVSVSGEEVAFGEPEPVRVEYVERTIAAATSATPGEQRSIVFANRAASRGVTMDPAEYRRLLGLAEDATDEQVRERAAELAARPEPGATPPPAPTADTPTPTADAPVPVAAAQVPPGFRMVSDAVWGEVEANARAGQQAAATLARQAEDAFVARHRSRIGASTNPHAQAVEAHLRSRWQANQTEAETFAASLPVAVPTAAVGHEAGAEERPMSPWTAAEMAAFPELRLSAQGGAS